MVGRKKEKNIVFFLSHRIGIMLLIFEYIRFENDADVSYNEFLVDFINTLTGCKKQTSPAKYFAG